MSLILKSGKKMRLAERRAAFARMEKISVLEEDHLVLFYGTA